MKARPEEVFFIILAALCGSLIFGSYTKHKYRSEAIELGYAKYDAQTGKWQWNKKGDK